MAVTDDQIKSINEKVIGLKKDVDDMKRAMSDINLGIKSTNDLLTKVLEKC